LLSHTGNGRCLPLSVLHTQYTSNRKKRQEKVGGNIEERKKMGRPTDSPKVHTKRIRMSEEEVAELKACAEKEGLSEADVIRIALQKFYEKLK